jgi:methionyl-tRNA formyltransferase
VIFFGTPAFAIPFFEALQKADGIQIAAVVTQPDQPAGRKQRLQASPLKKFASERASHMPILQPKTLRDLAFHEELRRYKADVFVVVAYGKLIPPRVLTIPTLGCVNVHPSLLPHYRGPSPIQTAIANGDRETGISIMLLDEGMDTGPVLSQKTISVAPLETGESLSKKFGEVGAPLLIKTIRDFSAGKIQAIAQDHTQATVTQLLTRDVGRIDWKESAEKIERKIRAYTPWPGMFTVWKVGGKELRIKILEAQAVSSTHPERANHLVVPCRAGASLKILRLQPEGKKPMTGEEFLRGCRRLSS